VWEWTRSLWGEYPYPRDQQGQRERENLDTGRDVDEVLRGGAFNESHRLVQCVHRYWYYPVNPYWGFGFRLVVGPCC
jgi:formylglycine-generating enzyme required for sulfatase activity